MKIEDQLRQDKKLWIIIGVVIALALLGAFYKFLEYNSTDAVFMDYGKLGGAYLFEGRGSFCIDSAEVTEEGVTLKLYADREDTERYFWKEGKVKCYDVNGNTVAVNKNFTRINEYYGELFLDDPSVEWVRFFNLSSERHKSSICFKVK